MHFTQAYMALFLSVNKLAAGPWTNCYEFQPLELQRAFTSVYEHVPAMSSSLVGVEGELP